MSNNVNTDILERVAEAIDNSSCETYIQALEHALDCNDLDNAVFILNNYCEGCGQKITANCNNANCGGF